MNLEYKQFASKATQSMNTNILLMMFFLFVYMSVTIAWAVINAGTSNAAGKILPESNAMFYIFLLFWVGCLIAGTILYFVIHLHFDYLKRTRSWMPRFAWWENKIFILNQVSYFTTILGICAISYGFFQTDQGIQSAWDLINIGNMIWWPSITIYLVSWSLRIIFSDEVG